MKRYRIYRKGTTQVNTCQILIQNGVFRLALWTLGLLDTKEKAKSIDMKKTCNIFIFFGINVEAMFIFIFAVNKNITLFNFVI